MGTSDDCSVSSEDTIYRNLQQHLDRQTLGFPATESGSDLQLLKQLFAPEQAEVTMLLTYRYETLDCIYKRAGESGRSKEEIERLLRQTAARGVIGCRNRDGIEEFRAIPYLVGMFEGAMMTASPEAKAQLMSAHSKYSADGLFWKDFINTRIPQMRTIPVGKSIIPEHLVASYDDIRKLVTDTVDPIVVIECVCRSATEKVGLPCRKTSRKETCMAFGNMAKSLVKSGNSGRQVTKEEALEILQKNQDEGLVLQPSNAQQPESICSCCGCCCGLLKLHKYIPNPVSHWACNFYAAVDPELCTGCGVCAETCQVNAITLDNAAGKSEVDLTRCLGCGHCVDACPQNAMTLQKKSSETVPPRTVEDTIEVIMSNPRCKK